MACFLVPAAEAAITTIAVKAMESKERQCETTEVQLKDSAPESVGKIPFSRKVRWLSNLLWGGSALLAFEHVWHGEVTPWFPFLTAAGNPADAAEMLYEMATAGVMMAGIVTIVWLGMVAAAAAIEKKVFTPLLSEGEGGLEQ